MLVSIIIPVFNAGSYLFEALDSAINQTYKNIEIIIVDDGSTDGSGKICDRYACIDQRIRVVHQKNKGLSNARNTGLDMMRGDMVAFLDSDDAYQINYIETMVDALVKEKTDLVICKYTVNYTTGKMNCESRTVVSEKRKLKPAIETGTYNRESALRALVNGTINCSVWNKLYKKELWSTIRFPDGHVYEDIDTAYRVFDQCANVFVLAKPLYMYRKRSGSIMETCSKKNITDCILACSHVESFVMVNTPIVFSEDNLVNSCLPRIKAMIIYYALYSGDKHDTNELLFCDYIKRQIMQAVDNIGLDKCGMRISLCSFLISYWPGALRIIYKVYHRIRRIALIRSMIFINCIRESIFQYYD